METIRTIEWEMLDKKRFFPLSMVSSFTVRCFLYPFTVIKTRLQLQRHTAMYTGTWDAFRKTLRNEGISGLYRGFWVSAFQLASGISYIATYESVRHLLTTVSITDSRLRALIGGGCASVVGQTIVVPFDVISQHLMVMGQIELRDRGVTKVINPLNIHYKGRSRFHVASDVIREVRRRDGVKGFYRGYFASLCTYVPNSAMWWGFYHFYQDQLYQLMPPGMSQLAVQCVAAPLGGFTTTVLTNPLDIVRARFQVQRGHSLSNIVGSLWEEEHLRIFTKGLSARVISSVIFSFMIILGYESVKRMSVKDEYRPFVRW